MKVLLDNCVWGGAKSILEEGGYAPVWVGDFAKDPGDEALIRLAYQQQSVLVTLDKDFGELAILRGMPHSGIIRIVDHAAKEQGLACLKTLQKYADELKQGAIITVEKTRTRVRPGKAE